MTTPRGIRNNNPGNIRKGTPWNGIAAVQLDPEYITFESPEYGIRAMARILRTYREQHGLWSVDGIIHRWAPPSDNNPTLAYVDYVAKRIGVAPFDTLTFNDQQVADLIAAIINFENGDQPYTRDELLAGVEMERTS